MLITIALLCIALTAVNTFYAALKKSNTPGQTVRHSIIEAWSNVAIEFGINYVANLLVLPLAGHNVTYSEAFWIGCIFTGISVVRSFWLRRAFNRLTSRN